MNMTLTPELEELVQSKIETGQYASADEVLREALRLLEERDRMRAKRKDAVRSRIRLGVEALDRGEYADGEEFFEELMADLPRSST